MDHDWLALGAALLFLAVFLAFVVVYFFDRSKPIPPELGPMAMVAFGYILYEIRKKNGGGK